MLAPAGSWDAMIAAIQNGADAVYLGGQSLNARRNASNFTAEEMKNAADYCHEREKKCYITLNTMLKQGEVGLFERAVSDLADAGADAAIVQDLGIAAALKQMLPDLALHASTQMAIHNIQGMAVAEQIGFSRVVLARELSDAEIAACSLGNLETEVFVHGALCVSCSGQCLHSSMIGNRSGNRGMCAQPCRLPYKLVGPEAHVHGHLLSTKDLMSLARLQMLLESGVRSLKIEGRAKRPEYVAVVVNEYRRALDRLYEGKPTGGNLDELLQVYNRGGFTPGYGPGIVDRELIYKERPNHTGVQVGTVLGVRGNRLQYKLHADIMPQDTVVVHSSDGDDVPLRLKEGRANTSDWVMFSGNVTIGDRLMRMTDARQIERARESYKKEHVFLSLWASIDLREGRAARLTFRDSLGNEATVNGATVHKAQSKPLTPELVKKQIGKMDDAPYRLENIDIHLSTNAFMPVSELNALRREALSQLRSLRREALRGCSRQILPTNLFEKLGTSASANVKEIAFQSSDVEELYAAQRLGADRLYLSLIDTRQAALGKLSAQLCPGKFYIVLPQVLPSDALTRLSLWAQQNAKNIEGIVASNIGQLAYTWPGRLIADYPMHIANRAALRQLEALGIQEYGASLELTIEETEAIDLAGVQRDFLLYGWPENMQLRHCPLLATRAQKHAHCSFCDRANVEASVNAYALEDRKSARYALRRTAHDSGCVLRLMNSVPINAWALRERLMSAKVWRIISDSLAPHNQALTILRNLKNSSAWEHKEYIADHKYSTGHYLVGVE